MKQLVFASLTGYVEKVDIANSTLMMGSLTLHFNESLADVYDGDVIIAEAQCDDRGNWRAHLKSMLTNVFIATTPNAADDASCAAGNPTSPTLAPAPAAQASPPLPPPAHTPVAATALSSRSTQFNRSSAPAQQTGLRSVPSPTATPAAAPPAARPSAPSPAPQAATGSSRAARFGKGHVAAGLGSGAREGVAQRPTFNAAGNGVKDDDVPF